MVAPARNITDRDRAYVLALRRRFDVNEFYPQSVRKYRVDYDLVERFNFQTEPLGDKGALGRLQSLGLLAKSATGALKLTDLGISLAEGLEPNVRAAKGTISRD